MVSEQTVLLSRQFWILSTEYKVIWTPVCTRAAYLLIQKRPSTQLTILYYYAKLSHYGHRGNINDWFASYLTDRTQTTPVEASSSSKRKILFGVSQGCVKGPLLFLINS